ncbi:unnamed protein product [Owenia fusiformis]|uniref:Uncharacterized protein n=1 Tax=Owenia fusiformis TaxID=6347 RepID=A0A8J1TRX7_OWEFU|nr:unnamed protein product [Owenia fusiformis]
MVRIKLVRGNEQAQKIVHAILLKDPPFIAVACKRAGADKKGEILLLTISTWQQQVYVFDIKHNPGFIVDGGLWRLLESNVLTKVWHDCLNDAVGLKKYHKVTPRKVYDTQIAYAVLMEQEGLPSRLIDLIDICDKYGRKDHFAKLSCIAISDHMFWGRRPLNKEMLDIASMDVLPLVPIIYEQLNRQMNIENSIIFEDICQEGIKASIQGKPFCLGIRQVSKIPIMRLNSGQEQLLDSTIPLSARGTSPSLSPRLT